MVYLITPQHPLSQGPEPNLPQNLTRPAQRALKTFKKNNEKIPSYKQNGVLPTTADSTEKTSGQPCKRSLCPDRRWWTVAFESGLFDDCHKAVCWKQTGLVKSASGPCLQVNQLVDSREYTVAYVTRPFKYWSQGLVTAATLLGFFNDCHKAAWWKQTGFAENATGPCEQIVNSRQQTVAYLIRSFEWLSQGLVTAATLSGFLNDCHKAVWRWQVLSGLSNDSHKAVWWKQMGLVQSVTGPCDQNDFATEFAIIRRKTAF